MSQKQTVGELVYKISGDMDNLKTELKKSEAQVNSLKNSMENTGKSTSTFANGFKNLVAGLGLAYLAKLAIDFGKASMQAYANAQQSLIQYNNAQENVAGSTKEQINDLNEYINLLEEKTSVDDKSIRQASQILAQDQIKIENQKKLLAGIVDIAVANSKSNGGEVDAAGTAVAIGRAMATGNLGALTRQNIVGIDEARAKAFQLGNEAQRTAIMMQLLAENGKGAGEALGNSAQGGFNKAKDKIEDLQVAVGKGLTTALSVLTGELGDTVGGLKITGDGTNKLGTAFTFLAGLIGFVINTLKLMGIGLWNVGTIAVGLGKVIWGFGKDVTGIFGKVGDAISSIGEAFVKLLKGDFKEAKETLTKGFDFSGAFDNSKAALDKMGDSMGKVSDAAMKTVDDMGNNIKIMATAGDVYKETAAANDKLTEAQDALKKKTEGATQATEDQKKASEDLKDKVLDLKNKVDDLVTSIGDKLTEATQKFKDSTKDIVKDSVKDFSDIVVNAEKEITDLKKQLTEEQSKSADQQSADNIKKLNNEITEKQKILTSYANFQNDLNTEIARVQKALDQNNTDAAANTDPTKQAKFDATSQGLQMQIDALKGFQDLDKQVAEARKLAGEDDFKQAEINTFAKIQLATNLFIEETTKLREKQAVAIQVEQSVTDFYKTQTLLRQKTLDAFATSSIATMKRIGDEAKSALAALNSLRSAGAQIDMPVNTIQTPTIDNLGAGNSTSSNTTNNTKNVNTPVTINANIGSNVDASQIAKELAWQISKK